MRRSSRAPQSFVLAILLAALAACSSDGDGRDPSTGKQANQPFGSTGTETGTETDTSTNTSVGSGEGGEGSSSIPNGKSLEQCTAEKKAWRAVVDSGKQPSDCTDPLVSWCCTREEIGTRFPSMVTLVEAKFQQFIDTDGMVLYHCSENAAEKKFTFHLGKIGAGTTSYKTVYISDVNPTGENGTAACVQKTPADLQAAGQGTGTETATGTGTTLAFTADIKPVLTAKCGGSNCHDDGGINPESSQWLNDEAKFTASDALARIQATTNAMPPAAAAALTPEEKAKLVDFLTP